MEKDGIFFGHLEYITAIWYILRLFGNLAAIGYIFLRFGTLCQEKSGSPGPHSNFRVCAASEAFAEKTETEKKFFFSVSIPLHVNRLI
jgi:hypothetical protein